MPLMINISDINCDNTIEFNNDHTNANENSSDDNISVNSTV